VQTLLNATKANVCANIVVARFFPMNANGIKIPERISCGTKANDEIDNPCFGKAEDKYSVK
jgi:hypothetical protein